MLKIQQLDMTEVFNKVLDSKQPLFQIKSQFINILKKQSKYEVSLSRDEVNWMVQNLDAIESIINSKKAVSIIWCLFKQKECYMAQISRMVRSYTSPVKYWINSLKKLWLIEERSSSFRNDKFFFHLNKAVYPNIIGVFLSVMKEKYGEPELNKMIMPDRLGGMIIDKQYDAIRKIRHKGPVKSSTFN